MVVKHKVSLPSDEELTVDEINLSTSALKAGAFYLGKYCEPENNEFTLCRNENIDPRQCLNEGKDVTSCAMNFFRNIKNTCADEFHAYSNCLFRLSSGMRFEHCRNTQKVFDKCVEKEMGLERPEYGYFTRIKVHKTNRPKPVEPPTIYANIPEARLPSLTDDPKANFGAHNVL